jgi:hypothetical protein
MLINMQLCDHDYNVTDNMRERGYAFASRCPKRSVVAVSRDSRQAITVAMRDSTSLEASVNCWSVRASLTISTDQQR